MEGSILNLFITKAQPLCIVSSNLKKLTILLCKFLVLDGFVCF